MLDTSSIVSICVAIGASIITGLVRWGSTSNKISNLEAKVEGMDKNGSYYAHTMEVKLQENLTRILVNQANTVKDIQHIRESVQRIESLIVPPIRKMWYTPGQEESHP